MYDLMKKLSVIEARYNDVNMPGPGDEATWPAYTGHPLDPRNDGYDDDENNTDPVDLIFHKIVNGRLELANVMAVPSDAGQQAASEKLHLMYNTIAAEHGLNPDDDFERIDDLIIAELEKEYQSEAIENNINEGTYMKEITLESLRFLSGVKAPLKECGMMPLMGSTPASISATAGSGPELSAMLKDIMSLAGLKQVGQDDMPADIGPSKLISAPPMAGAGDMDPMRSMIDIIDGGDDDVAEPAKPDSMNNDEMGGNGASGADHDDNFGTTDADSGSGEDDSGDEGNGVEDEGLLGTMAGAAGGAALGGPVGAAVGGAAGDAITGKEEESREPEYLNSPKEKSLPNPVSRLGDVNQGDHRERQKGLPQANPQTTAESLFADYKKFVVEESKKKPSSGMTSKEKSTVATKASAGKDIGKPGKNFSKVAKKAGGGEKGKKIAAAAMWKTAAKK